MADANLSVAWGRTLLHALERGREELAPMVVVIDGFEDGFPEESPVIRAAVDDALDRLDKRSVTTTANTIFPDGMWMRSDDRDDLYGRYQKILPRLHRMPGNSYGTYFERLTSWGASAESDPVNQLENVIAAYESGIKRRTALQASVFDPRRDLTRQPLRGFPCLEHVTFGPIRGANLEVTGFYATQYIVDRAYGNCVGLAELGRFVAGELGLQLTKVTCVASVGQLGVTKSSVADLAAVVTEEIQ